MKYQWVVLVVAGLFACSRFKSEHLTLHAPEHLVTIPVSDTLSHSPLSKILKLNQYIILDSVIPIGSISKVKCVGNLLYVGDFKNTKDVYCYDLGGKLLWQCNLNSPPSRIEISDFDVNPQNFQLDVVKESVIYRFDKEGRKTQTIPFNGDRGKVALSDKNGYLLYTFSNNSLEKASVAFYNQEGEKISNNISLPSNCSESVFCISNLNRIPGTSRFVFSNFSNDTIYHIENHDFTPKYVIDYTEENKIEEALPYVDLLQQTAEKNISLGTDIVYETERFLHFSYLKNHKYISIFYDKTQKKVYKVEQKSDDIFHGALGFIPYGVTNDNRFILIVEPSEILESQKQPKDNGTVYHPFFKELASRTTKFSNPVVVLAQFNVE